MRKSSMASSCFSVALLILSSLYPKSCLGEDRLLPGGTISGNQTIVSAGETFALGFFTPANSTNRYVGIWYNKITDHTVVWVANKENPLIGSTGVLTINADGNLVVLDENRTVLWSSNLTRIIGSNTTAMLLDTGNLELQSANQTVLWQSFDHPFGSLLPGMKLYLNLQTGQSIRVRSWKGANDPSPGEFSAGIDPRTPRQLRVLNGSVTYWRENVWYKELSASKPEADRNYIVYLSILVYTNEIFYVTSLSDNTIMARYVLAPTGRIELQSWRDKWNVLWSSQVNKCDIYGHCGPSASCNYNSSTSECICLQGFKPRVQKDWDRGNWSGGCVRKRALECGNRDGFLRFEKTKLPDYSISLRNMSVEQCQQHCLDNCSCTAYAYTNGTGWVAANCLIWSGELIDLVSGYGKLDLYIRLAGSELAAGGQVISLSNKKKQVAVIIISVIAASAGMLLLATCGYFLWRLKKKGMGRSNPSDLANEQMGYSTFAIEENISGLPLFNFNTIRTATDGFSTENKLGEGGFGPVYKGRLSGGQEVAVKRLSKSSGQGMEEFKNEVELIAKLQHRNLVRLLGWCIHGEEMMLIYEFMPNKSLDKLIFEPTQETVLDWGTRFRIIEGIAQGLLYLHRHSRLRVIHRDLKTSNILLDESMSPKISDFGLARIFQGNQNEANTKRVVGTYGYMSPEYALDGHFSEKSDVFSFGVLLLEIVSGKRNTGIYPYKQSVNLLGYAWELWGEGRAQDLIDPVIGNSCAMNEVMKCIHVALLCVQENPSDRPSMSSVVFMLGNETAAPPPPKQPAFSTMGFSISTDQLSISTGQPSNISMKNSMKEATLDNVNSQQ